MTFMPQKRVGGLIAQEWISLDGYAAGPDEDAIFSAVPAEADLQSQRYNEAFLNDVGEVMLGRRTYEMFREYWPTASEPIAAGVNGIPKVIASRTLAEAPWGAFPPAALCRDAVDYVRQRRCRTLLVWGSIDLVHSLLAAGLLDELDLFVSPIWLGGVDARCYRLVAPSVFGRRSARTGAASHTSAIQWNDDDILPR